MTSRDRSEALRRIGVTSRRLRCAAALGRLLGELDRGDAEARRLANEAVSALDDSERERRAADRFLGPRAEERMREAELRCTALLRRLAERERALSPAALRGALQRRTDRPQQELVDLLGFYIDEDSPRWSAARVDKVDLLLTRLGRRLGASPSQTGSEPLAAILSTLQPAPQPPIGELERGSFERNLEAIATEVEAADSLGGLIESGTLQRYRELKHRLGRLLLHPELLPAVLETNRSLEHKIRRLNSRTLTGIFSVYQGIFEVGFRAGVDEQTRREIDQLHSDFDRFEQRIKQGAVKLTELEAFWNSLRDFSERLQVVAVEEPAGPAGEAATELGGSELEEPAQDWLADDVTALFDLLRESDSKGWPADLVSLPAREGFQIDSREVLAFRRLEEAAGGGGADQPLETFLLKAAALRRAIKRAARKLAAAADSEMLHELPDFAVARNAVRLSESFLARYSQAVEQAVLDGDVEDAQRLQILRMRLVRESAGIWLQVYQQR